MSSFAEIIKSGKPVLVDFFAEWCGPCKVMAPVLREIAGELGDRIRILKVDVDKNPGAAGHYGVQAVPTLILFNSGEIIWRTAGAVSKPELLNQLKMHL